MSTTLIIGAGIAGLILARRLVAAGETVVLLDKSRGVGGRMATKRLDGAVFDQGAQFFTGRDPAVAALAAEWAAAGLVRDWGGGEYPRYVSPAGMTAVPKHLAEGLNLRREHKALAVRRTADGWVVKVENRPPLAAARLVLTAPVPQALALLSAGDVALPPPLAAELATLDYHPCLALLLALDGPAAVPPGGIAPADGPLRWLADNTAKGVSPGPGSALTVHSTPEFARAHYQASETEVLALLGPALAPWLGGARPRTVALHRWRYSEPRHTFRAPCLWLPEWQLGLAGDAFGGPKVGGAILSGLALAAALEPAAAGRPKI
jgi:predicted NAD/FAD-dependent oxidoreductase